MKYRIIKETFKAPGNSIHVENYYIQGKSFLFWHTIQNNGTGPVKFSTLQDAMKAVNVLENLKSEVTICQLRRNDVWTN